MFELDAISPDSDAWGSAIPRRPEAPRPIKSYAFRVFADHLPDGSAVYRISRYRIGADGSLLLIAPDGALLAGYAPGKWDSFELVDQADTAAE